MKKTPAKSSSAQRRVLIVADTHGAIDPRIVALAARCDAIVHAGDIGNARVLAALNADERAVYAVAGNNDTGRQWPADERAIVARLPREVAVDLPGGRLVVVHGDEFAPAARRHELLRRRYANARAVAYGHSHRLVCDRSAAPWILNPGAAGKARTHGGPSCLLLTAGERRWHVRAIRFSLTAGARSFPSKGLRRGAGKD